MSGARAAAVRGGLVFLSVVSAVQGVYILASPEGFFAWSWVNMGMEYNPHLMLDFGAMNLALAVPLGVAAVVMSPVFVRTMLASYAMWAVAHFLIHLRFRSHFAAQASAAETNLLVGILGFGAAATIALLLLTVGRRAGSDDQEGELRGARR